MNFKRPLFFALSFLFFEASFVCFAQGDRKFSLETDSARVDTRLVVQESNSGSVYQVGASKDGRIVWSEDDGSVKFWDAESGLLLRSVEKKKIISGVGRDVAVSPNADFCYYISLDDNIERFDIVTGKKMVVGKRKKANFSQTAIAISPNGKYVAYADGNMVELLNTENFSKEEFFDADLNFFTDIAFSPDSSTLAACCSLKNGGVLTKAALFDVKNGKFLRAFEAGPHSEKITFSPNGKYLLCLSYYSDFKKGDKKHITVVDVKTEKIARTIDIDFFASDLKFSPDSTRVYATGNSKEELSAWKIETGEKISLPKHGTQSQSVAFFSDGKRYIIGCYRNIEIRRLSDFQIEKKIGGTSKLRELVYADVIDKFLVPSVAENESFFIDNHLKKETIAEKVPRLNSFSLSGNGVYYASNSKNGIEIYRYEFGSSEEKFIRKIEDIPEDYLSVISNSSEGMIGLFAYKSKTLYIYNLKSGKLLYKIDSVSTIIDDHIYFSPKQKFIAIDNITAGSEIYETKSGKKVDIGLDKKYTHLSFSPDEKYCALNSDAGEISVYDTNNWSVVKKLYGFGETSFSHDGRTIAITDGDGNVVLYDISTGKKKKTMHTGGTSDFFFTKDDSKFIVLTHAGIVRCWSVETGELLASVLVDDKGDWLTYTPEGYFMGSKRGVDVFVHVVNGLEVLDLGQFYEPLYRPDLIEKKMNGESLDKAGERRFTLEEAMSTGDAPAVFFENLPALALERKQRIAFNVQDRGGGIGSVFLSVNGRAYKIAKSSGNQTSYAVDVTLSSGENVLEVYATNSSGKIQGRRAIARISWNGKAAESNLYVLVLGVNKYDSRYVDPLNFAVPDAKAMANLFKSSTGNIYKSVNVFELYDEKVNRAAISHEFKKLSKAISPDDVFVFYLAGHGVMHNGDFYYLPADFKTRDANLLDSAGVSKEFLMDNLSEISAGKILVMFDTCQSGAFIAQSAFERFGDYSNGVAIIAASSDSQSALEGYEGHGVFTYAVLEALSGKADFMNEGNVSVSGLSHYVNHNVPLMTMKKWNKAQSPWSYIVKEDFIILGNANSSYKSTASSGVILSSVASSSAPVSSSSSYSAKSGSESSSAAAQSQTQKTSSVSEKKNAAKQKTTYDYSSDIVSVFLNMGYAKGAFFKGFDFDTSIVAHLGRFVFLGGDIDAMFTKVSSGLSVDISGAKPASDSINFLDFNFLLGLQYKFKYVRPYTDVAAGYYFSMLKNSVESPPSGFSFGTRVGLDFIINKFSIGASYKLMYLYGSGWVDVYSGGVGFSF